MHLVGEDVTLAYEESGAGSPIVFIHGWCCDRSHFERQVAHFAASHRCISVDLRGHGESDAPDTAYSIRGFADDVAWLCGELGVERPVVVGHSMGGAVALSLSVEHPELPSAIVMLDGALVRPDELIERWRHVSAGLHSAAYEETLKQIFGGMFLPTDTALTRQIIEHAVRSPRHVVLAAWGGMDSYDSHADAVKCGVPAMYVGSTSPVADMHMLKELMPGITLAQTAGAGHFHQLEVPDQINAMIERFMLINGIT